MGPDATPLILIAFLVLIGVPVLSIVAYVRVSAVKRSVEAETALLIRRIYALEQQMAQIEKGLASLGHSRCRDSAARSFPPAGTSACRAPISSAARRPCHAATFRTRLAASMAHAAARAPVHAVNP